MHTALNSTSSCIQSELKRIKAESDGVITDLEERMADSDRKARSAEEYLGMREELLKEKASLQEQMQDIRNQFEHQISEMERQHVQDRCDISLYTSSWWHVITSLNLGDTETSGS